MVHRKMNWHEKTLKRIKTKFRKFGRVREVNSHWHDKNVVRSCVLYKKNLSLQVSFQPKKAVHFWVNSVWLKDWIHMRILCMKLSCYNLQLSKESPDLLTFHTVVSQVEIVGVLLHISSQDLECNLLYRNRDSYKPTLLTSCGESYIHIYSNR